MIVTLTINPTIDRVISVDRLAFDDRAYINSTHESPGGRGINASCVIHSFGGNTLALMISGGANGQRMEKLLKGCVPFQAIPVEREIRTNLTITDRHGLTVNLNEKGPELGKQEVARVEAAVRQSLDKAEWLMICGSTPPGVPAAFYGKLVSMARKKKVRTLLHADGESLRLAIEEKPTVVTPNQHEAERLLGKTLLTRTHYLEAAHRLRAMGPDSVVLSLGSRGAVGAFSGDFWEALPPRIDAVCPIGAGDALSAAYVWSMAGNSGEMDALRWGVAAGTAKARLPGMKFASLEQTKEIYANVEMRRAD